MAWIGALSVGISLGLLGSGGSILTVPVLIFLVGEGEKVLEIGTGSGYQAAVLAEMGCDVYSIEIL